MSMRRAAGSMIEPTFLPGMKARWFDFLSHHSVLASLWYLGRRAYRREQRAMLAGIARYHRTEATRGAAPVYRLRRSIHRIEKGLIAAPRRPVFAEGYIESTVDAYERLRVDAASRGELSSDALLSWAFDVLTSYFAAVGSTPAVDRARAALVPPFPGASAGDRVPRPKDSGVPKVQYGDLLELAKRRRSVREFLPCKVPRDLLDQALDVARQSPSACNRQAFEFRLYDDPERAAEIASIAPGFSAGPAGVPCMGVVIGKYRAYYRERDQHVIYVDASLAVMALVLALESLGLASCCINWPSLPQVDERMEGLLGLAPDEEVIMLMAIGYADPEHASPYSEKAPLDELRSYNREGPG